MAVLLLRLLVTLSLVAVRQSRRADLTKNIMLRTGVLRPALLPSRWVLCRTSHLIRAELDLLLDTCTKPKDHMCLCPLTSFGVVAICPQGHAVHSNSKSKPSTGFGGTLPRACRWLLWHHRSVCHCGAALWVSLHTLMPLQYLVHFDASSTSLEVLTQQIQTVGGHVSSYIPEDTLLVVAQASLLSQLQAQSGVAWVGDYLPKYKIAPEAQLLNGFLKSDSAALLSQQRSANHSAAMSNAQMHNFIRQAPDGTSYIPLDVSFPHHLPDMLGQLQDALELCNTSNTNTPDCSHQAVAQQLGSFWPSHAATADWQVALDRMCDSQCSFAASGAERLVVNTPVKHLQVHTLLLPPPLHLHVSMKTDSLLIQDLVALL